MKIKVFEGNTPTEAADKLQKWINERIIKIVNIFGYTYNGCHVLIVLYEYPKLSTG
jgi:hypothetical protein